MPIGGASEDAEDVTRQQTGLALLAGIANKAFALKRFDEAERILGKHLNNLLMKAKDRSLGSEELIRDATAYALKLAEGLSKAAWIDWIFELQAATRTILSSSDVEKLHSLVRRIHYDDPRTLRAYLATIRPTRDRMTAAERFVLQRLEGLERVISA